MEIFVGEKETNEYVEEVKKALEGNQEVIVKGKSRDSVKAVDTAELLKREGYKAEEITIDTIEENETRVSVISIKITR